MPGISIHVVDVSRGLMAAGMAVELFSCAPGGGRQLIAEGVIGPKGLLSDARLDQRFSPGLFEAIFHIADYYKRAGVALPATPFLEIVTYRFGVADPEAHYHLPFKCTPWGYSCFRGG